MSFICVPTIFENDPSSVNFWHMLHMMHPILSSGLLLYLLHYQNHSAIVMECGNNVHRNNLWVTEMFEGYMRVIWGLFQWTFNLAVHNLFDAKNNEVLLIRSSLATCRIISGFKSLIHPSAQSHLQVSQKSRHTHRPCQVWRQHTA